MNRVTRLLLTAAFGAVILLAPLTALAQTTLPPRPAPTAVADEDAAAPHSRWHLGVTSGATQVGRTSTLAGVDFGIRLRPGLHIVFEGGRMSDVVTQSRIDEANGYMAFVRDAYDVTAEASMRGNALFAMAGLRLIPDGAARGEGSGVRPYATAMVGFARVEYNPRFLVDGQDISGGALGLYGVTLGRDLLGTTNKLAYSGGAGFIFGDTWYLDLGVRFTRIHTTDHATNVKRIVIGMGRRF